MNLSWDERWQLKKNEALPPADLWLLKHKNLLSGGLAIDLACGRGRNSFLLADLGYQVLALDSSATALDLLLSTAVKKSLSIEVLHDNLEATLPGQPDAAALILCFYFLQRSLFPAIKTSIAPGGLFIGRSFCQLEQRKNFSDIVYEPGELRDLFSDWDILDYEEGVEVAHRGGTLAGIVARKPVPISNKSS